jgi:hypothetical protein
MKQILQNVVNFEKPKVVLTRCNTEKEKHVPLLMEIGGYIVAMMKIAIYMEQRQFILIDLEK